MRCVIIIAYTKKENINARIMHAFCSMGSSEYTKVHTHIAVNAHVRPISIRKSTLNCVFLLGFMLILS